MKLLDSCHETTKFVTPICQLTSACNLAVTYLEPAPLNEEFGWLEYAESIQVNICLIIFLFKRSKTVTVTSHVKENYVRLKLVGTHQLLAYADDMNLLGDNIDTIKKNRETLIGASKDVGLEINAETTRYVFAVSLPECTFLPLGVASCCASVQLGFLWCRQSQQSFSTSTLPFISILFQGIVLVNINCISHLKMACRGRNM
jgi:hypothetical protein